MGDARSLHLSGVRRRRRRPPWIVLWNRSGPLSTRTRTSGGIRRRSNRSCRYGRPIWNGEPSRTSASFYSKASTVATVHRSSSVSRKRVSEFVTRVANGRAHPGLKHDALVVERGPGRRRRIRLDVLTTATGDGCIAVYEEECLVCLVEAPQAHIEAAASKMADALTSARRFADQAQNAGNAARTRMTLSEMVVVGLSIAVLTNAIIQTYMQHRSCTLS